MRQRYQHGLAPLWLVLGAIIVIGAGAAGYALFSRGRTPPFVGVWKIEQHYVYGSTTQSWLEDKSFAESEAYLRFTKDGGACKGAPAGEEFQCVGTEERYVASGAVIEFPHIATPMRMRWSTTENTLELIGEYAPSGQWLPREKFVLMRLP